MKQIKLSSAIVHLMTFDVVRAWVSTFPCYRKDNYIVKYLQLTEPLFSNCHFFLIRYLIYTKILHNKMHGITVYSSVLLSSLGI